MKNKYWVKEKCPHCGTIVSGPSWGKLWACIPGCGKAITRNPCPNCKGLGYIAWTRKQWIKEALWALVNTYGNLRKNRCPICHGSGMALSSISDKPTRGKEQ